MPPVFVVTLDDVEGHEPLSTRQFSLALGGTFPIGRASRNTAKAELMPAVHNAYFDSPVISRDHAVLSATANEKAPEIFVTDSKSMHGTLVNGERLEPNVPKNLNDGDILQLGVNVNRNEEYFIARKYKFKAFSAPPPQGSYSLGYSVPDGEDEEISGTAPRRGSQDNPLTIEDSEAESETPDEEQAEVTMLGDGFGAEVANERAFTNTMDEIYNPLSSDDEESLGNYPDDYNDSDAEVSADSAASIMGDTEIADGSDFDGSDASDQEVDDMIEAAEPTPAPTDTHTHFQATSSGIPPWAMPGSSTSHNSTLPDNRSELPSMSMFKGTVDTGVYNTAYPPPFPPRPSGFRLYNRGNDTYPPNVNWSSNPVSTFSEYLGTNHGDRPSLFSPAPVPTMTSAQQTEASTLGFSSTSTNFAPIDSNNRLQTPPPMPSSDFTSMPSSDFNIMPTTSDFMSSSPAPGRRTKVSITEIVEEQPPTPESVNDLKRKADVFDYEGTPQTETGAVVKDEGRAGQADVLPASIQATIDRLEAKRATEVLIASRPKKQPRSLLKKLGSTATFLGYSAVGAAGAVALLTCLPDAFFA